MMNGKITQKFVSIKRKNHKKLQKMCSVHLFRVLLVFLLGIPATSTGFLLHFNVDEQGNSQFEIPQENSRAW